MLKQPNTLSCPLFLKLCECAFRDCAVQWAEQTRNVNQTVDSFLQLKELPLRVSPGIVVVEVQQTDCTIRQLLTHFQDATSSVVPIVCFEPSELPQLCELSLEFNFIPAVKSSDCNSAWQTLAVASSRSLEMAEVALQGEELRKTLSQFTNEQRKLLTLWIEGLPNKQLSSELDVCLRTVQLRKQTILSQFGAASINEILLRFVRCKVDYQS